MSIEDAKTDPLIVQPPRVSAEGLAARAVPSGLGIYTMELEKLRLTPAAAAARAKNAGLSFVALLACWQEESSGGAVNRAELADYGAAFREAGLDVWVWGYPFAASWRITDFVATMKRSATDAGAAGILLDPEDAFTGARARWMAPLLRAIVDVLDESLGLGITSFGVTKWHPTFPWADCGGWGWGSPQTYTVSIDLAVQAIAQWRELGWTKILPSLPTYGLNSEAKLAAYAAAILEHADGGLFWQWASTDDVEWRTIEALAARATTVPARMISPPGVST